VTRAIPATYLFIGDTDEILDGARQACRSANEYGWFIYSAVEQTAARLPGSAPGLELGVNYIDTAPGYADSDSVGAGLKGVPNLFLSTKLWAS
jgi:aryl-alcohol dehydrogenase-like predicted oxidoreductase